MSRVMLGPADAFRPGARRLVQCEGRDVLVLNVGGRFHAVENRCPHAGASLQTAGSIRGDQLVCDWHDMCFDLATGESDSGFELRVYRVGADQDGCLYVEPA